MKISYQILKRYLEKLNISPKEIEEILTNQGLVVERTFSGKEIVSPTLVAATLEEVKEEKKQSFCTVRVKEQTFRLQVESWKVPPTGSRVIWDKNLTSSTLASTGPKDSNLLITLPAEVPEGEEIFPLMGGEDTVFEVEVTANRGDCLSVIGLAREVGAALDQALIFPKVTFQEQLESSGMVVENQREDLCPFYSGKYLYQVVVKPSPWWLVRDLLLLGLRPINNLVDVTNWVMMELGQPLHAFDVTRLRGRQIKVRGAVSGEKIITLDQEERELTEDMLVIADSSSPVGIAGVMGGFSSQVLPQTREVFLESAWFNPSSIRRTSRQLGLRTEASRRFERGIDPEQVVFALERALSLMQEIGEAKVSREWFKLGKLESSPKIVEFDPVKVEDFLSVEIESVKMEKILHRLGFEVEARENRMLAKVPSWRQDVDLEVDIAEEVGRIYGYNRIASRLPSFPFDPGEEEPSSQTERAIRAFLVNRGLKEIVSLPLIGESLLQEIGFDTDSLVMIKNPLSLDYAYLRPSLVVSVLEVLKRNITTQKENIGIFEIGKVFGRANQSTPPFREEQRILIAIAGQILPPLWHEGSSVDIFVLKGIIEELLGIFTPFTREVDFYPGNDYPDLWEPSWSFSVRHQEKEIAWGGLLRKELVRKLDFWGDFYLCELRFAELMSNSVEPFSLEEIKRFPAVLRDISLLVEEGVSWRAVEKMVLSLAEAKKLPLEQVDLFDCFQGGNIPLGKKNLSFHLIFRSTQTTLNDQEVDQWVEEIKGKLRQIPGAQLREELTTT